MPTDDSALARELADDIKLWLASPKAQMGRTTRDYLDRAESLLRKWQNRAFGEELRSMRAQLAEKQAEIERLRKMMGRDE